MKIGSIYVDHIYLLAKTVGRFVWINMQLAVDRRLIVRFVFFDNFLFPERNLFIFFNLASH
jgi:hypothetical protein